MAIKNSRYKKSINKQITKWAPRQVPPKDSLEAFDEKGALMILSRPFV